MKVLATTPTQSITKPRHFPRARRYDRVAAVSLTRLNAQVDTPNNKEPGVRPGSLFPCYTIPELLQFKFLPRPRTQNSPDLPAVDRGLIRGRHGAFHLLRKSVSLGRRTVQSRPVLIRNYQVNIRIIFGAWLYCDHPVTDDITGCLRRLLRCLPFCFEILHVVVKLPVFGSNCSHVDDRPLSERMVIRDCRDAC